MLLLFGDYRKVNNLWNIQELKISVFEYVVPFLFTCNHLTMI